MTDEQYDSVGHEPVTLTTEEEAEEAQKEEEANEENA